MTAEDLELFKKHFELYECYKKHSFIRNYSKTVYTELIHLYTTYISTKHTFSHWSEDDITFMPRFKSVKSYWPHTEEDLKEALRYSLVKKTATYINLKR